jgi:hypothetical protein
MGAQHRTSARAANLKFIRLTQHLAVNSKTSLPWIFSQTAGSTCEVWVNPANFIFGPCRAEEGQHQVADYGDALAGVLAQCVAENVLRQPRPWALQPLSAGFNPNALEDPYDYSCSLARLNRYQHLMTFSANAQAAVGRGGGGPARLAAGRKVIKRRSCRA